MFVQLLFVDGPQLSKEAILQASKCPLTSLEAETKNSLLNKPALNNPGPAPSFHNGNLSRYTRSQQDSC